MSATSDSPTADFLVSPVATASDSTEAMASDSIEGSPVNYTSHPVFTQALDSLKQDYLLEQRPSFTFSLFSDGFLMIYGALAFLLLATGLYWICFKKPSQRKRNRIGGSGGEDNYVSVLRIDGDDEIKEDEIRERREAGNSSGGGGRGSSNSSSSNSSSSNSSITSSSNAAAVSRPQDNSTPALPDFVRFQVGFSNNFLGTFIYYFSILFIIVTQILLWYLCKCMILREDLLWVSNGLFELEFCTQTHLDVLSGRVDVIKAKWEDELRSLDVGSGSGSSWGSSAGSNDYAASGGTSEAKRILTTTSEEDVTVSAEKPAGDGATVPTVTATGTGSDKQNVQSEAPVFLPPGPEDAVAENYIKPAHQSDPVLEKAEQYWAEGGDTNRGELDSKVPGDVDSNLDTHTSPTKSEKTNPPNPPNKFANGNANIVLYRKDEHTNILDELPRYCNLENGQTGAGYEFNNAASVFLFVWFWSLLVMGILFAFGDKIRNFFRVNAGLSDCEFVVVEEWERDWEGEEEKLNGGNNNSATPGDHTVEMVSMAGGSGNINNSQTQRDTDRQNHNASGRGNNNSSQNHNVGTRGAVWGPKLNNESIDANTAESFYVQHYYGAEGTVTDSHNTKIHYKKSLSAMNPVRNYTAESTKEKLRYFVFECIWFMMAEEGSEFTEPVNEVNAHSCGDLSWHGVKGQVKEGLKLPGAQNGLQQSGIDHQSAMDATPRSIISGSLLRNNNNRSRAPSMASLTVTQNANGEVSALNDPYFISLSQSVSNRRIDLFGHNQIYLEVPPWTHFLANEFIDFLTLIQLQVLWAPILFTSVMVSVLNLILFLLFGLYSAYINRELIKEMYAIAAVNGTEVDRVYFDGTRSGAGSEESPSDSLSRGIANGESDRNGVGNGVGNTSSQANSTELAMRQRFVINSTEAGELVHGDIIRIVPDMSLPCDCVLLNGGAVVDESNLTGEAMPIQKFPFERDDNTLFSLKKHGKRHILYSGTRILQVRSGGSTTPVSNSSVTSTSGNANGGNINATNGEINGDDFDEYPFALVLQTGIRTTKGVLMRRIVHPNKISFTVEEQILKAVIFNCLVSCGFVTLSIIQSTYDFKDIIVCAIFEAIACLSRLISPMQVCGFRLAELRAAGRLKKGKNSINCIQLKRIPLAGKVKVQCFDKTGTLTHSGLDFFGYQEASILPRNANTRNANTKNTKSATPDARQYDFGVFFQAGETQKEEQRLNRKKRIVSGIQIHREAQSSRREMRSRLGSMETNQQNTPRSGRRNSQPSSKNSRTNSRTDEGLGNVDDHFRSDGIRKDGLNQSRLNMTSANRNDDTDRIKMSLMEVALCTCHTTTELDNGTVVGNSVECGMVEFVKSEFKGLRGRERKYRIGGGDEIGGMENNGNNPGVTGNAMNSPEVTATEYGFFGNQDGYYSDACLQNVVFRVVRHFEFDQHIQLQSVLVEVCNDRIDFDITSAEQVKNSVLPLGNNNENSELPTDLRNRANRNTNTNGENPGNSTSSSTSSSVRSTIVFSKGSPQKLKARCRPETLPAGFDDHVQAKAKEGLYIIAVGCRKVVEGSSTSTSPVTCGREELEKDLTFVGLIFFRNEIKECSPAGIKNLKDGGLACQMITGDNIWTGLHVAKKVGIVDGERNQMIVGDVTSDVSVGEKVFHWSFAEKYALSSEFGDAAENVVVPMPMNDNVNDNVNNVIVANADPSQSLGASIRRRFCQDGEGKNSSGNSNSLTQTPHDLRYDDARDRPLLDDRNVNLRNGNHHNGMHNDNVNESNIISSLSQCSSPHFILTQTGFNHLLKHEPDLLKSIYSRVLIFGSMNPQGKIDAVKFWKDNFPTAIIGMCGDGGNDCGALRTADFGVALCERKQNENTSDKADGAGDDDSEKNANPNSGNPNGDVSIVSAFSSIPNPRSPSDKHYASIDSVVEIVREGRCCLVNSIACFKFFVLYGLLYAYVKNVLTTNHAYYCEYAFMFQDGFMAPLVSWSLASSGPNDLLFPRTPTTNVLGPSTAIPVLTMLVLAIGMWHVMVDWVGTESERSWYDPADPVQKLILPTDWWGRSNSYLNGMSLFWQVFTVTQAAIIFSFGNKFRKAVWRNWILIIGTIGLVFTPVALMFLVWYNTPMTCMFRMNCDNVSGWNGYVPFFTGLIGGGLSGREIKGDSFWFEDANDAEVRRKIREVGYEYSDSDSDSEELQDAAASDPKTSGSARRLADPDAESESVSFTNSDPHSSYDSTSSSLLNSNNYALRLNLESSWELDRNDPESTTNFPYSDRQLLAPFGRTCRDMAQSLDRQFGPAFEAAGSKLEINMRIPSTAAGVDQCVIGFKWETGNEIYSSERKMKESEKVKMEYHSSEAGSGKSSSDEEQEVQENGGDRNSDNHSPSREKGSRESDSDVSDDNQNVSDDQLQSPVSPASESASNNTDSVSNPGEQHIGEYMCQKLCRSTWQTDVGASFRFYGWWALHKVEFSSNERAVHQCFVLPRLEVRSEYAVGPDVGDFERDSLDLSSDRDTEIAKRRLIVREDSLDSERPLEFEGGFRAFFTNRHSVIGLRRVQVEGGATSESVEKEGAERHILRILDRVVEVEGPVEGVDNNVQGNADEEAEDQAESSAESSKKREEESEKHVTSKAHSEEVENLSQSGTTSKRRKISRTSTTRTSQSPRRKLALSFTENKGRISQEIFQYRNPERAALEHEILSTEAWLSESGKNNQKNNQKNNHPTVVADRSSWAWQFAGVMCVLALFNILVDKFLVNGGLGDWFYARGRRNRGRFE